MKANDKIVVGILTLRSDQDILDAVRTLLTPEFDGDVTLRVRAGKITAVDVRQIITPS